MRVSVAFLIAWVILILSGSVNGVSAVDYLVTPYNFSAYILSPSQVKLAWADCWDQRFRVYQSTSGPDGEFRLRAEINGWEYNPDVSGGGQYWFYVTAVDDSGESLPSYVLEVASYGIPKSSTISEDLTTFFKPLSLPPNYFGDFLN